MRFIPAVSGVRISAPPPFVYYSLRRVFLCVPFILITKKLRSELNFTIFLVLTLAFCYFHDFLQMIQRIKILNTNATHHMTATSKPVYCKIDKCSKLSDGTQLTKTMINNKSFESNFFITITFHSLMIKISYNKKKDANYTLLFIIAVFKELINLLTCQKSTHQSNQSIEKSPVLKFDRLHQSIHLYGESHH